MKDSEYKAAGASWTYEQEKRQSRKQSQQLRQRKQSRKGFWVAE